VDAEERNSLIEEFRGGYEAVVAALAGAAEEELDRIPPNGDDWSARMVVHHLADSEATAYVRLRRLIAEDEPTIVGYDEVEFAQRLHYDRPIESSLAVLEGVRIGSVALLESLTQEEWRRSGLHTETGRYSVEQWVRTYARHPYDHADQIRRARRGEA
jgi:hypothetical protein